MTNNLIALLPLGANDAAALMAFYNGLTPATIHTFRPLCEKTTMTVCEAIIKANLAASRQRFDLGAWQGGHWLAGPFLNALMTKGRTLGWGLLTTINGRAWVAHSWMNCCIGRALQEAALRLSKELGCYQLRSHSSGDKTANHQLKLAMGFALHRIVRGEDRLGGYFIMPLRTQFVEKDE